MAKFKIQAGAEIDVLTENEMRKGLKDFAASWMAETTRGDKYRRFSTFADISGAEVTIGAGAQPRIGPAEGFIWAVKRIALTNYDPSAETLALYLNSTESSAVVHPSLVVYNAFDSTQLVMYPGDTLVVYGSSLSSTGRVWLTGQARELPIGLAWRLS